MKLLPYIFYLILIAFQQVILGELVSVWGVTINLTGFIAISVALYKSELTAVWFGFIAGVVMASGTPDIIGWHGIALSSIALSVYYARARLNLESHRARLLLMFGGILLHNVFIIGLDNPQSFLFLIWPSAIGGALYTTILAALFFAMLEGTLTYQKLKAIF